MVQSSMKLISSIRKIYKLTGACLLFTLTFLNGNAQDTIAVCTDKTVHLIFSAGITSHDRGSQDIIVKNEHNHLKIKATVNHPFETNLFLMFDDGSYKNFIVSYAENPFKLVYDFQEDQQIFNRIQQAQKSDFEAPGLASKPERVTETTLEQIAHNARAKKRKINSLGIESGKVLLLVKNIFVHSDYLVVVMQMINSSHLEYWVDYASFTIIDKKNPLAKKAIGNDLVDPVFIDNAPELITKNTSEVFTFIFDQFNYDDKKHLNVKFLERNGDRDLEFNIDSKYIISAKSLRYE